MALGRNPHRPEFLAAAPTAADYMGSLPTPPDQIDWSQNVAPDAWGVYANAGPDAIGDCTACGAAHATIAWESYGMPGYSFPTTQEVIAVYSATGGYVPGQPATDNGATCEAVLTRWLNVGFTFGGKGARLIAYAKIDPKNFAEVRQGLWAFGQLYVGAQMMVAQQSEAIWTTTSGPVWGGHCFDIIAADADANTLTCISWGQKVEMTADWFAACVEECYVLLSPLWLAKGAAPSGLEVAALQSACIALG